MWMGSLNTYNTGAYGDPDPLNSTLFNKDVHGIYLVNCLGPVSGYPVADAFLVAENSLLGPDVAHRSYATYRKCGITLEESRRITVRCNRMNNIGIGLYFKGNDDLTNLSCNTFGFTTSEGMQFSMLFRRTTVGGDGKIGTIGSPSLCQSNYFVPASFAGGFQSFTSQNASPSSIFYDDQGTVYDVTSNSGNTVSANWLQIQDATAHVSCSCGGGLALMSSGNTISAPQLNMMDTQSATKIIDGTIANEFEPDFKKGGVWLNERVLYTQLDNNPEAIDEISAYQQFYDGKKTTSVGQIEELNNKLSFLSDTSHSGDITWYQLRKQEVFLDNNTLPETELFEINEKQINALYLIKVINMDSLSPVDKLYVKNLALSCPLVAGTAVYKARAIYSSWNPIVTFDDDYYCQSRYGKREDAKAKNPEVVTYTFKLQPNPAKDIAYLYYRLPDGEHATYSIYSSIGELIAHGDLEDDIQLVEINTNFLEAGLYYIKVQQGLNILYASKMTIIK